VFLLPIISALIFGSWFALHQGQISISFKDRPKDMPYADSPRDYQVWVKIVNGLGFENILLANVYDNALNFLGMERKFPIHTQYLDIDNDGQQEIEIIGYYLGDTIKYLLKKENGQYKIVHNINEVGADKEAFSSEQISFLDMDGDLRLEVATDSFLDYENAPDQVWTNYYRLVGDHYQFYKQDKVNFSDFKRLFAMAPDYYARK